MTTFKVIHHKSVFKIIRIQKKRYKIRWSSCNDRKWPAAESTFGALSPSTQKGKWSTQFLIKLVSSHLMFVKVKSVTNTWRVFRILDIEQPSYAWLQFVVEKGNDIHKLIGNILSSFFTLPSSSNLCNLPYMVYAVQLFLLVHRYSCISGVFHIHTSNFKSGTAGLLTSVKEPFQVLIKDRKLSNNTTKWDFR